MDQLFDKEAYVRDFQEKLESFQNHPLNYYEPTQFKFAGQGGQSKVLSFYSQKINKELVVKIYPSIYYSDAKNEFDNMRLLLDHPNILQVYEFHTIYVGDQILNQNNGSSSDSQSSNSNQETPYEIQNHDQNDFQDNEDENAQHANILIIMEKADKSLLNIINQRKKSLKPFSSSELFEFWRKIINTFAFCNKFKITHNDIKPSNILLKKKKKNNENQNKKEQEIDINQQYDPKISDFGTSIQMGDLNEEMNSDILQVNNIGAMTPSYASPNVIRKIPKINPFIEDVFSLGLTFLQMACLLKEFELNQYYLNQENLHFHQIKGIIGNKISEQEYMILDPAKAQEFRVQCAIDSYKNIKKNQQEELPYFFQIVLKKMLRWEELERLNFVKLMNLFKDSKNQLLAQLDNRPYIDNILKQVMESDDNLDDEEFQFEQEYRDDDSDQQEDKIDFNNVTQQIKQQKSNNNNQKDQIVNEFENRINQYQTKKFSTTAINEINAVTTRIRQLNNGVTKLISGKPDFEFQNYKHISKTVFQSDSLIVIDYQDVKIKYDQLLNDQKQKEEKKTIQEVQTEILQKLMINSAVEYLPNQYDRKKTHPERSFLFLNESITAVIPDGKIFVMGGQFYNKHSNHTYSLILPSQRNYQHQMNKPFQEYAHLGMQENETNEQQKSEWTKNRRVKFFDNFKVQNMLSAKSAFGHCSTIQEIIICGGTSDKQFSLNQVESYDIKKDVWIKQPDLNIDRRMPGICMFRNRWLYVFGGTQFKMKSDAVQDYQNSGSKLQEANQIIEQQIKEEDEDDIENDKSKESEKEQNDDQLSAAGVDEDFDFIDIEEEERNYQLDFYEHYVSTIERFDMQVAQQRGKIQKWEIIKLRNELRIEGSQFASLQITADEIIIFGSNFKNQIPHFSEIQAYKFNHDLKQIQKLNIRSLKDRENSQLSDSNNLLTQYENNKQKISFVDYENEKESFGCFDYGFYSDAITVFEKYIVTIPQMISKNPENVQIFALDIKKL